jgi:hypothetical protein
MLKVPSAMEGTRNREVANMRTSQAVDFFFLEMVLGSNSIYMTNENKTYYWQSATKEIYPNPGVFQ